MGSRGTVSVGPFLGGLNNRANTPDTLADNELFECIDFDYNTDGTLVTRPAIFRDERVYNPLIDGYHVNLLGFFVDPATGIAYMVAEINQNIWYRQAILGFLGGTWTNIVMAFGPATGGIQYVDKFYFIKQSAGGGSWSPSGGYVAVASNPGGSSIALFKERLWLAKGTTGRLFYSNVGTGGTWSGSDFIDVDAGNGQNLSAVYAGPSALYLFKTGSIYVLTYDALPARGSIQNISTDIGLANSFCYTVYEGAIFILHGANVYRLDGYSFTKISLKIDVTRDSTDTGYQRKASLSTVGNRIIVQYRDNNFVYYPQTNTWTQWKLSSTSKWYTLPDPLSENAYKSYVSPQNIGFAIDLGGLSTMIDSEYLTGAPVDDVVADPRLTTKMYTFDSPEYMKRLHWWGVDAIVSSIDNDATLELRAVPYLYSTATSWDLLTGRTWDTLKEDTWTAIEDIEEYYPKTTVNVTDRERKYIKAHGGLRFPRIQFKLRFVGYAHTATSSINHIIANISQKQNPAGVSEGTQL